MSYFEVIGKLRETVHCYAVSSGIPNYRSLILIVRQPASPELAIEVKPCPIIQIANQNTIAKLPRIEQAQVKSDDFTCNGVSRLYTYDFLNSVTTFLIDGELVNSKAAGGIECSKISISEGSSSTWNLVLRRKGRRG